MTQMLLVSKNSMIKYNINIFTCIILYLILLLPLTCSICMIVQYIYVIVFKRIFWNNPTTVTPSVTEKDK